MCNCKCKAKKEKRDSVDPLVYLFDNEAFKKGIVESGNISEALYRMYKSVKKTKEEKEKFKAMIQVMDKMTMRPDNYIDIITSLTIDRLVKMEEFGIDKYICKKFFNSIEYMIYSIKGADGCSLIKDNEATMFDKIKKSIEDRPIEKFKLLKEVGKVIPFDFDSEDGTLTIYINSLSVWIGLAFSCTNNAGSISEEDIINILVDAVSPV